jgi:hypothetical protein
MGLNMYAKATSPIRRYFDMLLHHQLRAARPLTEPQLATLLPSAYRHEQYLKQLQKLSTRYWTLAYIQRLLSAAPQEDAPYLTTRLIVLDSSTGTRQKLWIESLALILYGTLLGKGPGVQLRAGQEIERARILSVDPMRSAIELAIV